MNEKKKCQYEIILYLIFDIKSKSQLKLEKAKYIAVNIK